MKRFLMLIASCAMLAVSANATIEPFNGLIVDGEGKPVKGVKVWVTSESAHSTSDKQGRFGFSSVEENDTLKMNVKKDIYKIAIEGRKSIKITLVDSKPKEYKEEPEIADIGYGYIKRRERMTATNGITGAQLRASGANTLLEALRGLVPGLNVASGPRGADMSTTTMRGVNTFNSSPAPLYVVDGVIVDSLDGINIHSVEMVEVLKDGSIYGSRGAGGVISVTTKRN